MIGKPVALIQVPNQRLFGIKAAARYLDMHAQTLRKLTDLGEIKARKLGGRRAYTLEELDRFIDTLPEWYHDPGEKSGTERRKNGD
jgi:excisionase family DNA binding protein